MKFLLSILKKMGLIAKIIPALLRAWAEGSFGDQAREVYWKLVGYKTVTGAILMGLGAAFETIAAAQPEWAWAVTAAKIVFWLGAVLSSVGLVDAGVRSPWPNGTEIPPDVKAGPK